MNILLTGASGFLGNYIHKFLLHSNNVQTIGRGTSATICQDLSQKFELNEKYDCVVHAAGKAHLIPYSEEDVLSFWKVNVIGTQNLLKALEHSPPQRFVFLSSVAVYGKSYGIMLNEETPILALDPYGQSKIQAEAEVIQWCNYNSVNCTILRLPLVYGDNPPGNLKSMFKAIRNGYYFNVDGGQAKKSIVRVEDVARFIIPSSEVGGIFNLTDGVHHSFHELSHLIGKSLGRNFIPNMPLWVARILARIGDFWGPKFPFNSDRLIKITSDLTFDDSLARSKFGWNPFSI